MGTTFDTRTPAEKRRHQEALRDIQRIRDIQRKAGGVHWCNSHQRIATHKDDNGNHVCDPGLGGRMIPCNVVFAEMTVEPK